MTPEERFWNRRRLAQTLTAVAALWAVAALLTLAGGWRSSAAARAAAGWAAVEGRVTAVEVVRVAQRGRVPFTVPAVRVAYNYTFGDRAFSGERLRADGEPVSPQSAAGRGGWRWLLATPSLFMSTQSTRPRRRSTGERPAAGCPTGCCCWPWPGLSACWPG